LFFPFAQWLVVLGGNGDDGSVDDLPARSQIAPIFQIAVEVLKHRRDHTGLRQLLPIQPYRLGIRNFVFKDQSQKTNKRKPVANLVLLLII